MTFKPLILRRFDAETTAEKLTLETPGLMADLVFNEAGLTRDEVRDSILATDMDHTMFRDLPELHITGDLGVLVFLEKLTDPTFWTFSPSKFKKLLLPEIYRKCAIEHLPGGNGKLDINPVDAKRVLDCWQDLVELYALQKELVKIAREKRANGDDFKIDIDTPVVNEFALKMIEFDSLVKMVENPLMDTGRGRILMRTRFFAGKNIDAARMLARQIMERTNRQNQGGGNGHVHLGISEASVDTARQLDDRLVYHQRITDIGDRDFNRVVAVNEDIRRLTARLTVENGAFGAVVSANLRALADEAVAGSPYRAMISKIIGSRLRFKDGGDIFTPEFEGEAIHGNVKVRAVEGLMGATGKKVRFALGDSARGDGPMGLSAIKNGGIFVATGHDFESIQREFDSFIGRAEKDGIPDVRQRTWTLGY